MSCSGVRIGKPKVSGGRWWMWPSRALAWPGLLSSLFVREPAFASPTHPPRPGTVTLPHSPGCVTPTRPSPFLNSPLAAAPASSAHSPRYFMGLQASCLSPLCCRWPGKRGA